MRILKLIEMGIHDSNTNILLVNDINRNILLVKHHMGGDICVF